METLKFELHDMATMMTAILCFLFATMIVASGKFRPISACLLAGFFLSQSFVSLHELVLYGDQFRYTVLNSSPNWFFIGSLGYALDGPLLYLYVVSIIRPDFHLSANHLLHLLPLIIYFIFLFAALSQVSACNNNGANNGRIVNKKRACMSLLGFIQMPIFFTF